MKYIKFDTITSTNDFLKSYSKIQKLPDFFYVYSDVQTKGRGQQSNIWQSDCCKNVLVSFYLEPAIPLTHQIRLSRIVALAIIKVLEKFNIPDLKIKLPNDIMSDGQKIAGILIENVIKKNTWQHSIIGIGLNVNQTNFHNLPNATSMTKITKKKYNIEEIILALKNELIRLNKQEDEILKQEFERLLINRNDL